MTLLEKITHLLQRYPRIAWAFSLETTRMPERRLEICEREESARKSTLELRVQRSSEPPLPGVVAYCLNDEEEDEDEGNPGEAFTPEELLKLEHLYKQLHPESTRDITGLFRSCLSIVEIMQKQLDQHPETQEWDEIEEGRRFLAILQEQLGDQVEVLEEAREELGFPQEGEAE